MRPAARRRVVAAYEAKLRHPFADREGRQTTLRDAMRTQALRLAEAVLSGSSYVPFELP